MRNRTLDELEKSKEAQTTFPKVVLPPESAFVCLGNFDLLLLNLVSGPNKSGQ